MRKAILAVACTALLAGCAAQRPQMTRAQYLEVIQRTYENKTPDDVYAAAERLFTLADGDDFQFFHTEDSMVASRRWMVYVVFAASVGMDTWTVRARQDGTATKVSVAINTAIGNITPMPTTGGDMTVGSMPTMAGNVPGTAIYDVFWSRMDYLLGRVDKWMTCEEADHRQKFGPTWGDISALCNGFNLKDELPEELRKKS